jgi:hypothetical protein
MPPKLMLCTRCLSTVFPKTITPGSTLITIILLIFFFVPGVIYWIWRATSRYQICPACGSREIIPADSPQAIALNSKKQVNFKSELLVPSPEEASRTGGVAELTIKPEVARGQTKHKHVINTNNRNIGCVISLVFGAVFLILVGKCIQRGNLDRNTKSATPAYTSHAPVAKTTCPPGGQEAIQELIDIGLLISTSSDGYDAYVSNRWYTSTLEQKKMIAMALQRCVSPGLHITIYDGRSGKKLAQYSEALGFSLEE